MTKEWELQDSETESVLAKHYVTDKTDRRALLPVSTITWRFARLHPSRMELGNILSEWLRNPGKLRGHSGDNIPKNSLGKSLPPPSL